MAVSTFDLFKIGVGPSSSHTVGPMKAACSFARRLGEQRLLNDVSWVRSELFGSLGHTGRGHGTDKAVMLGLEGELPDRIDPDDIGGRLEKIFSSNSLTLDGKHSIEFLPKQHMIFHKRDRLPFHSNGMRFSALDSQEKVLLQAEFYSVGGGFVVSKDEAAANRIVPDDTELMYPFKTGDELLELCSRHGKSIAQIMLANEHAWRSRTAITDQLKTIWEAMQACVARGIRSPGELPGGLRVQRRAPIIYQRLNRRLEDALKDPLNIMDWVNLYALAVNEENAVGGRVVTAPTNGAAGIVPAVLHYYDRFCPGADWQGVSDFLLTAAAVGILFKENASISGAEVGCQGEVGVACSMAAAGLTAALGGSPTQVENAAEIGMEHNLGLTCDPIGGLVQIPCIERNAMGAVKAINAQRMAVRGDGKHHVSLDKVIKTMRETGADMKTKYKETSRGGLAVNVVEC
ncbi:MAG: L-serine ammonia-lyase [Pseudomonadota bacterium]